MQEAKALKEKNAGQNTASVDEEPEKLKTNWEYKLCRRLI